MAASSTPDYAPLVESVRAAYQTGRTRPLQWRLDQLQGLQRLLVTHEAELTAAVVADLGKPETEVRLFELGVIAAEIKDLRRKLPAFLRPKIAEVPLNLLPVTARIVPQPLGVVLVISPWNYPLQLLLSPVIGALAAGNAVVLKPSEVAPRTAEVIARLLPRYLDAQAVRVVQGGVEETTALLRERFDHIVFTGNSTVGRVVMRAAAEHLTPVTLELGGKSPVFVDESVDPAVAARRIAWGKWTNAGQTCVSPDYVLVTPGARPGLLRELERAARQSFGEDQRASADYGRIVNERHFDRLHGLLEGTEVVFGGEHQRESRYLAPTVVSVALEAADGTPVMLEEIFGPILPVLEVAGVDEAIGFINARPHPLALYVFSQQRPTRERFVADTTSGGLVFNAALVHLSINDVPFGGVGESGLGAYHGRFSLERFSHLRPVVDKPLVPDTMEAIYPPYSKARQALIKLLSPLRR